MADPNAVTLDDIFERVLAAQREQPLAPTPQRPTHRAFQYQTGTLDDMFDRVLTTPYEPPPPPPTPKALPPPPPPQPGWLQRLWTGASDIAGALPKQLPGAFGFSPDGVPGQALTDIGQDVDTVARGRDLVLDAVRGALNRVMPSQLPTGAGIEGYAPPEPPTPVAGEAQPAPISRVQNILELIKNWTIGPFVEAGKVLRGRSPTELEAVLQGMSPEQRAVILESGILFKSPLNMTPDELATAESKLLTLGMIGAGGHLVGGPRFGGPPTPIPFVQRPRFPQQPQLDPSQPAPAHGVMPPPEMNIPPRPEAAPLPSPPGPPKALPPAPALRVTPEGQVIPRAPGGPVGMTEAEIAAARQRLVAPPEIPPASPVEQPVQPIQTFTGKIYAERQANAASVLGIPQTQLKAEVKALIKSKRAKTGDEALAIIAARKATAAPGPPTSPSAPVVQEPTEVMPTGKPVPTAPISREVGDRLHAIGTQVEDARTALPTPEVLAGRAIQEQRTQVPGRPEMAVKQAPGGPTIGLIGPSDVRPLLENNPVDNVFKKRLKVYEKFDEKGFPDVLAKWKVTLKDEANREALTRIAFIENQSGSPTTLSTLPSSGGGRDFGLFQLSPENQARFHITKKSTPQQQTTAAELYLEEGKKAVGNDPLLLNLWWNNPARAKQIRATLQPLTEDLQLPSRGAGSPLVPPEGQGSAVGESSVGAARYEPPPYTPEQLAAGPGAPNLPPEISMNVLAKAGYEALGQQVEQLFRGTLPNPDARFFRNVGAAVKRGDIVFPGQKELLAQHNLTADMLGDELIKTATHSGQTLNLYSQWSKRMQRFARENPELAAEMNIALPPPREPLGWFKRMDNTTKAAITGRIGTAMRNLEGGIVYNIFDAFDNAIANVVTGAKRGNVAQELAASTERFSAMFRALSPSKQKELTALLNAFPLEKMELLSTPVQDVILGGKYGNAIVKAAQFWNKTQEMFVRRLALDGSISEEMARRGLVFDRNKPSTVPVDIMQKGVSDALRITMAARPEKGTVPGVLADRVLRAYHALPVFSLVNPFPRFQYANAFRFIWEHSPAGPIDLMTKGRLAREVTTRTVPTKAARTAMKRLADKNAMVTTQELAALQQQAAEVTTSTTPTLAAKAAQAELANPKTAALAYAKAASGIGLFTAALAYRSSENAPAKWYEINTPWGTASGEAFAPFITYNLFAEAFRVAVAKTGSQEMKDMFNTDKNPPHIELKDLARAAIGLNRIAGTGLVFVDLLQKGGMDRGWKNVSDFFGQYIGRLTVPLSSYKNILGSQVPEEAIIRDTRDAPLTGPIRRNVPILDQTLPASPSLTRSGPRTIEHPAIGEFPGVSIKTYTDVEKELARLGFTARDILSPSGIPEVDRATATFLGPFVEHGIGAVMQHPNYRDFSTHQQEAIIGEMLSALRKVANERARTTPRPPVALELFIKKLPQHIRPLILESPQYQILKEIVGD